MDEETRTRRQGWELEPVPLIAVLTRSCHLDFGAPFFTLADRSAAAAVGEVIVAGGATVDLHVALKALSDRGVNHVLAEGGPTSAPSSPPPTSSTSCA